MDLGLNGKIALVAAASKGLGRAVAEELAAEGASLVLCARGNDELQATCVAIEKAHGVPVLGIAANVPSPPTWPAWCRPPWPDSAASTCW